MLIERKKTFLAVLTALLVTLVACDSNVFSPMIFIGIFGGFLCFTSVMVAERIDFQEVRYHEIAEKS